MGRGWRRDEAGETDRAGQRQDLCKPWYGDLTLPWRKSKPSRSFYWGQDVGTAADFEVTVNVRERGQQRWAGKEGKTTQEPFQ